MVGNNSKVRPRGWIKQPTNLEARLCGSQIKLTWKYDGGKLYPVHPTGFCVFKSQTTEFTSPPVKVDSSSQDRLLSMSWFDSDMKEGETYYYRVQAYYYDQVSGFSNTAIVTMNGILVPSGLTATKFKEAGIKLDWKLNSSNITSVCIERSVDKQDYEHLIALIPAVSSYIDSAVEYGKDYKYKVQNKRFTECSDFSNESNNLSPVLQELVSVNAKAIPNSGVELKWAVTSELANGYEIEKKEGALGFYGVVAKVLKGEETTLTYLDKNAGPNKQYCYRIRAYKADNDKTIYAAWYEFGVNTFVPEVPKPMDTPEVTCMSHNNMVYLEWFYDGCALDGFVIERSTSHDSGYTGIATVSARKSGVNIAANFEYVDKKLEDTVAIYFYRIKAYKGSEIKYSDTHMTFFDIKPNQIIQKNDMLIDSPKLTSYIEYTMIVLQWTYNGGKIDSFNVERSSDGNKYETIAGLDSEHCNCTDTQNDSCTCFYRIRAHSNCEYSYSNVVQAV
jgi:hypothetical protein